MVEPEYDCDDMHRAYDEHAFERLRKVAALLLQHAEHGINGPMPQWLVDCRRDIEAAGAVYARAMEGK